MKKTYKLQSHKLQTSRAAQRKQSGQAIIISVVLSLAVIVVIISGMVMPIANQIKNTDSYYQSKKAYIGADTINEEALYRLNKGKTLPAVLSMTAGGVTSEAIISDVGGLKQIIATGELGNFARNVKGLFGLGNGLSINYGVQVGSGGLVMSGSTVINGNAYINGNITGTGVARITGTAIAAADSNVAPEIENTDDESNPSYSVTIGKTNGPTYLAQSFTVSTTTPFVYSEFFVKKAGAPSNLTVAIYTDNSGSPSGTRVGTEGTLSASLVTTSYGWVKVYPSIPVSLTPGVKYWLRVEASQTNSSNYYTFGQNNAYSYGKTLTKEGHRGWEEVSPSARDQMFKVYTGGPSLITGMIVGGDAKAYIVNHSTVSGSLYCNAGSDNNKNCDSSQVLPSPANFPVSDPNIAEWKENASAGTSRGTWTIGGSTATSTNGPLKINGNLTIDNSGELTIRGPIYVTGNLTVSGAGLLKMASSYGSKSEVIVVDGRISIGNSGYVSGSGTAGSYIALVTTSNGGCETPACSGTNYAISIYGAAGSVLLISPNGRVLFDGSASAKAAVCKALKMEGATSLTYETGLADVSFTTGPSGAWNVESWTETSD